MSERRSRTQADLLKFSATQIPEQQRAFGVRNTKRILIDLRIHVPISDKNIFPSIVVDVEKLDPETKKGNAHRPKVRGSGDVGEFSVVIVVKQIIGVVGKVSLGNVGPAVVVV